MREAYAAIPRIWGKTTFPLLRGRTESHLKKSLDAIGRSQGF